MAAIIVIISIFLIIFWVETAYYRRHALDDLNLKVDFSKNIANYGEDIELIEVVENRKKLPLPFIILKFEAPREIRFYDSSIVTASDYLYREDMLTMKAFSKHTRRIKVRCKKRGYYVFPRVGITTADLFLVNRINKDFDNDSSLVVLPEILPADMVQILMSVSLSDLECPRSVLTDPFAISGLREYGPDDPMNSINWKASARTGELMVNQNASTCARRVHIFVNLEKYDPKGSTSLLERSISLAYSYLISLSERGISTSIYTNGIDILTDQPAISETDPGTGTLRRRAVMLSRIDLNKKAMPFEELIRQHIFETDDNDFILYISAQFSDSFQSLLYDLRTIRPAFHWIMPCYNTTPEAKLERSIADSYTRWGGSHD